MDPDKILEALRPLVLVVDATGTIVDARGGFGGFFGDEPEAFMGSSVFDHVAEQETDELARYFLEAGERSAAALTLPLPFRVSLVGADGIEHPVDVIPTGSTEGAELRWIVTLVPLALQTAVSRSLDAEMAGVPRDEVKRLLTAELMTDNVVYSTRWFLVDLDVASGPTVTTARPDEQEMADVLALEVARGWRPWGGVPAGTAQTMRRQELPDAVRAVVEARGWRRVAVIPVHVDGTLVAAYMLFGRVPEGFDVDQINSNVLSRIQRLVDATALLIARWRDRDRLVAAATRDPLTGLANRDAFANALAGAEEHSHLLYIDIDRFKRVNDRYGHDVGDQLLREIAERIVSACRPADVVARFGGDEFVVLLEGVDRATATHIGERIMERVAEPLAGVGDGRPITVSVGLAEVLRGDDVVKAADQAMLQAKRAGRARLVAAPTSGAGEG